MLRVFFTIVLPLVLPTAIYVVWVTASQRGARRPGSIGTGPPIPWATLPWPWLIGAGAVLLVLVMFAVSVHFGTPQSGVYVPPQWKHGRIIPGHIEPVPRR